MKRLVMVASAVVAGVALLSTPALSKNGKKRGANASKPASSEVAALVKYRHELLESVAKHMGLAKAIVMGKVDRPGDLPMHARALHDASKDFTSMFPEGSGPDVVPQTDALATVWTDWSGFEARAKDFESATATFLQLAEAGDVEGAKAQLRTVGQACGSCHDSFRKDEG